MNNLVLKEKQEFMGIQIPVIEGGFGEGQKVILAKTVAEIHEVSTPDINKLINRNIERFTINDLLDIKSCQSLSDQQFLSMGFTKMQISKAENIFLLSQRGYTKLVAMMDNSNDKKWDVMNNLIDDYFSMKAKQKENILDTSELSPELQMFNKMLQAVAKSELEQKKIKQQLNEVNHHVLEAKEEASKSREEVQAIREVVAINSSDWKNDCKKLITKIAYELGGISHINDVYKEVYSTLDKRMKTKLSVRLTNKRRRMADEGVCKSKRDKH